MKRFFMVAISLIASVFSYGQNTDFSPIKFTTSFGTFTTMKTDIINKFAPVLSHGVEFNDRIGFEFGYSWRINNSTNDINDYINGVTNTYDAGMVTRIYSVYYKTKRDDRYVGNIGLGLAHSFTAKAVNTDPVFQNKILPFFRYGFDSQVSKLIGVTLNMGLGEIVMVTGGITISL
jgi:hypothetical protein